VASDATGGVGGVEEDRGRAIVPELLPVASEHHVQRHQKEKAAEHLSEDVSFDPRRGDRTDRRAEEEPESE
jgi:hypothetical protein